MHSVLIIDDNTSTLETAGTCLRLDGFDVVTAESGAAGIALAVSRVFDLILLDLRLEDMSGVEVIRHVRAVNLQSRIIMVTAFPDLESSFNAGHLGADGYVEGPLFGDDLCNLVADALRGMFPIRRARTNAADAGLSVVDAEIEPRIREILHIIKVHTGKELTTAALARRVGLSPSRLQHLFKLSVGTSLHRYVINCRLEAAARLLSDSGEHVRQIAFRVGFGDVPHFRQLFRTCFGVSPRRYRQNSFAQRTYPRVQPNPLSQ